MADTYFTYRLRAVNAAGNIMDPASGKFIAGGRTDDGRGIADLRAGTQVTMPRVEVLAGS